MLFYVEMHIINMNRDRYQKAAEANETAPENRIFLPEDFEDDASAWAVVLCGIPERQAGFMGVFAFDHFNPELKLLRTLGRRGMQAVIGNEIADQASYRSDDTIDMRCLEAMRWIDEHRVEAATEMFAQQAAKNGVTSAFDTFQQQNIGPAFDLLHDIVRQLEGAGVFPSFDDTL